MKFENEFVNLVTSDTQLEQMYKNRFDKLNTELKDLQAKVDKLKKQEDEALVKAQAGFDESIRWIKEFDDKGDFYKATHPSERGRYEVRRNNFEIQINSIKQRIKDGTLYKIPSIIVAENNVLDKKMQIADLQKDYDDIHKVDNQTKEIKEAIDKNVGLSKQEFDDIVKSQLDIELQKKETEKVKIFMGVGLGLVTLLILFKLKK